MNDAGGFTYCFLDIEVDGPDPGRHSMLSFACAAYDDDEREIGTFARNLIPLPGAGRSPKTMKFWASEPEAWAFINADQEDPARAMADFVAWAATLPEERVLCCHPIIFDAFWLDWYLRKFVDQRALQGPFDVVSPFAGGGIDVPSYVRGAVNQRYSSGQPAYPAPLTVGINHSHKPIDDARGHATLFFNTRRWLRQQRIAP
jgi:hypothetical protein